MSRHCYGKAARHCYYHCQYSPFNTSISVFFGEVELSTHIQKWVELILNGPDEDQASPTEAFDMIQTTSTL
jgi:hypothetical protein